LLDSKDMGKTRIEPKIAPLVKAINASRIFKTFSSCQGHFGKRRKGIYTNREKAEIRCNLAKGVSESEAEILISRVLFDHVNSESKWHAQLHIYKEFICLERDSLEHYFVFEIRPFNPNDSNAIKRSKVNKVILEVTESIKTHSK
jgi:hypothetical protein